MQIRQINYNCISQWFLNSYILSVSGQNTTKYKINVPARCLRSDALKCWVNCEYFVWTVLCLSDYLFRRQRFLHLNRLLCHVGEWNLHREFYGVQQLQKVQVLGIINIFNLLFYSKELITEQQYSVLYLYNHVGNHFEARLPLATCG